MNILVSPSRAETRVLFTIDELQAFEAKGFFKGRGRLVLLDGVIHEIPTDGFRHTHWAMEIAGELVQAFRGNGYFIGIQTTLHLSARNAPSPDIYVLKGPLPQGDVPAQAIALVIEVADTSLSDDLSDSASRYARHGVEEFWVVDVNAAVTHVHRTPADGAYPAPRVVPFAEQLTAVALPEFSLRLADLAPRGG
jgi:Uma2 family endonuclease